MNREQVIKELKQLNDKLPSLVDTSDKFWEKFHPYTLEEAIKLLFIIDDAPMNIENCGCSNLNTGINCKEHHGTFVRVDKWNAIDNKSIKQAIADAFKAVEEGVNDIEIIPISDKFGYDFSFTYTLGDQYKGFRMRIIDDNLKSLSKFFDMYRKAQQEKMRDYLNNL